ncbi:hypothetical protein [Actinomadura bangladeshensis]|uniref:Uncharacterized protein n=1 Tax=Actinomadura bangladeshensis TaxID=453573 RepID=A0A4R4PE02_9ACTN|nr:hypothetical protein [Actinomadura bangladeshensis]TDC19643.1 hypothetical protein E1284_02970 [Actinomadura bangladeshensis]
MPPTRSGLPPEARAWPGLESTGPDLVVGDVTSLARRLERQLETVISTATAHLRAAGSAPPAAFGRWDAAVQLAGTAATAHAAIGDHHLRFVHAMQAVVKKLYATANVYDRHEAEIEAKIRELDRLVSGAPPSVPTSEPSPGVPGPGPTWPEAER